MKKDWYLTEIVLKPGESRRFVTGESWYQFLMIVDNDCLTTWEEQAWRYGCQDIVLMQPGHRLTLQPYRQPARIICLRLSEQVLVRLSDKQTDLLYSMCLVPFGCAAVQAGGQVTMLVRNLAYRLMKEKQKPGFGNTLLEHSLLSIMLVLILRACIAADLQIKKCLRHFNSPSPSFMRGIRGFFLCHFPS